jgi:outer membrane protein assembly factor BamC
MNQRRALRIAVATALLALAGCTVTDQIMDSRKIDYKSVRTLPTLEIPPDLTKPGRDDRFSVPDASRSTTLSGYQAERTQRQATAAEGGLLPRVENVRIERSGNQRWLVVQDDAEKLWPVIKEFWQENGFLVSIESPESGVMETDWAENRAKIPLDFIRSTLGRFIDQVYSSSERDKFRTRLERTADGKGTEIYISHRGMEEVYQEKQTVQSSKATIWQPRAPDSELEAEFVRRLMVRLGVQEERAKQVVASATQTEMRAQLKNAANGGQSLEVYEPFDRAWRRVGLALDRVGFTVEDRDRQNGLYFVRYADPDAEMDKKNRENPGLLSKLQFWKSNDPQVKAEQFRVSVTQTKETSVVQVLAKEGSAPVNTPTAHRILALLLEQLK